MSSSYIKIIAKVIQTEGGDKITNDINDRGGLTKFGISKRSYPNVDIANLTLNDAIEIYKRDYWDKLHCDSIKSDSVAYKLFDIAVNCGTGTAGKMLQRALGFHSANIDGIIGDLTLSATNNEDQEILLIKLTKELTYHYAKICNNDNNQYKYIKGWNKRAFTQLI